LTKPYGARAGRNRQKTKRLFGQRHRMGTIARALTVPERIGSEFDRGGRRED
jgi:hypothetical protein